MVWESSFAFNGTGPTLKKALFYATENLKHQRLQVVETGENLKHYTFQVVEKGAFAPLDVLLLMISIIIFDFK